MNIIIACDPNAQELKKVLINFVRELGHEVEDGGSDDPIYANTAIKTAQRVVDKEFDRGILICGTGIGVCISANKVKGAYCALVNNVYQAERAQLSNNANLIALGAQVTGVELAKALVRTYLSLEFDIQSKSAKKIARITEYEEKGV